jgi:hypothetical protein
MMSSRQKENLAQVNDIIRGMNRHQVTTVNNSLMKRLSDPSFGNYTDIIEGYLRRQLAH